MRKIETTDGDIRVSTGPIRLGSDWPGVFIRGDQVDSYTAPIKALIAILEGGPLPPDWHRKSYIETLKRRLAALDGYWLT